MPLMRQGIHALETLAAQPRPSSDNKTRTTREICERSEKETTKKCSHEFNCGIK